MCTTYVVQYEARRCTGRGRVGPAEPAANGASNAEIANQKGLATPDAERAAVNRALGRLKTKMAKEQ